MNYMPHKGRRQLKKEVILRNKRTGRTIRLIQKPRRRPDLFRLQRVALDNKLKESEREFKEKGEQTEFV